MTADELNQQCIAQLETARLSQFVAVVGSGPSAPFIAPISKLEEQLANHCGVAKGPREEFWNFAERAFVANEAEYFSVIKSTYQDTPYWTADVYRHLTNIPFKSFASFNYDDQLPKAFRDRYPDEDASLFSVYPPWGDQTYTLPLEMLSGPQRLIALHGYSNPHHATWEREVILRTTDYNQHYGTHPAKLFDWWRTMLLAGPCLFVGTSLTEPGLYRVTEYLLESGYRQQLLDRGHLHLMPADRDQVSLDYPVPGHSLSVIKQIYFDRLDNRYTGLLKVLSHFSNLPSDRPHPNAPALKPITPTDTFNFAPPL